MNTYAQAIIYVVLFCTTPGSDGDEKWIFFSNVHIGTSIFLMIFAGTPATIQLSPTSLLTTAFAPIITLFPTWIFPMILAPAEIYTSFPMIG